MKKTKTPKRKSAVRKAKTRFSLPVVSVNQNPKPLESFPLTHYSYSTFVKFSTNPIMFKINYINGDRIDTTRNISGVVGNSFHTAMEAFYNSLATGEGDPVAIGLAAGMEFLENYEEGFIEYSTAVATREKALENLAAAFNSYMNDKRIGDETLISCEEMIEADIDLEWRGQRVVMPVKLKGYIDKIVRGQDGKLRIVDYKTTRAFSDPDKIDGSKILQAIQYYFLVYAKYGEAPHSMVFEEVKISKNRDGGSQVREYEVVYEDSEIFFDIYFRFYDDMTRAINGEAVFVPNIYAMFDNEVSMVAYANRLDVSDEAAAIMKKLKVDNISDALKKKIESATSMRRYLKNAEKKFISGKTLKYENMTLEDRIKSKIMEHGMMLHFDSVVSGHTFDLYKFVPGIGLKMTKLMGYVADIEQVMGVANIRILAPIPNSTLVGFEVPKAKRTYPKQTPEPQGFDIAVGVDINNEVYRFDIRETPHMLIAGATGSGKSVFLNSVITQISKIPNTKLNLFDPKIVELRQFKSIAKEYLTDTFEIGSALRDLVVEMNERYEKMAEQGVRNVSDYKGDMPYIFTVIDEYADLTLGGGEAGKAIPNAIQLLAQKGRACGLHIIIATQRPSADVITGTIKANFPTKVAFRTAKQIDSMVLLDEPGAEKLLGKGDMLFSSDKGIVRLQGFNA